MVVSSHNPDHAFRFADRAVLMRGGTVVAAGPAGWVSAGIGFVAMRRLGNFFLALALAMAAYLTLVLTMGA